MIRFYTIHHCRYCLQSLAIKYTRKDTAFRTELSQGLSAISCVYYKTYTSFKGAKIQIYFYNKKLFLSFLSEGRFGMGAKYNVRDLRKKRTQQHRAICNGGRFAIWANCNMGELHHILRCASSRTLPLQRTQTPSYQAHDVFFCIYMYICERSENTRVEANCN